MSGTLSSWSKLRIHTSNKVFAPRAHSWARYTLNIRSLPQELTVGPEAGKETSDDSTLLRAMIEKATESFRRMGLKLSWVSKKASRGRVSRSCCVESRYALQPERRHGICNRVFWRAGIYHRWANYDPQAKSRLAAMFL